MNLTALYALILSSTHPQVPRYGSRLQSKSSQDNNTNRLLMEEEGRNKDKMSLNEDTPRKHGERDNTRLMRDHRSSAPTALPLTNCQPRRSALTALPDMNPYHHGSSRFTETFSSVLLRGQRVSQARDEQQATSKNPLRFSQRFAPPGIRDLSGDRSEYESQATPFGLPYSEPRPARVSLHQSQEFQDMAREQQNQEPILPATVPRAQQHQRRDTPPINAPRGPANPHRHQYRHTLAPDFRPTTPTPPFRSGNRYRSQLQQQRQDVSHDRPTHAHSQPQAASADIYGNTSASQRPLPRHIIGRACPLGDRNCHHHHGVPCHQYWEHCRLARKSSRRPNIQD